MKKCRSERFMAKPGERSFTLFETIVALGIMAAMMVQLTSVYGNSIYFTEYADNMTKGIWLARRVMSQVEYVWMRKDFTEINEVEETDVAFEGIENFRYSLTIKDWKLPILDMLAGGGPAGEEDEDKPKSEEVGGGTASMVKDGLSQSLGKELLKIAHVSVSWPEGAKRNDVTLTFLLTNQRKADEAIGGFKSVYDQLMSSAGKPSSTGPGAGNPSNPANPGTPGNPANPANPANPSTPGSGTKGNPSNPSNPSSPGSGGGRDG